MEASRAHVRLEAPQGAAPSGYRGRSVQCRAKKPPIRRPEPDLGQESLAWEVLAKPEMNEAKFEACVPSTACRASTRRTRSGRGPFWNCAADILRIREINTSVHARTSRRQTVERELL